MNARIVPCTPPYFDAVIALRATCHPGRVPYTRRDLRQFLDPESATHLPGTIALYLHQGTVAGYRASCTFLLPAGRDDTFSWGQIVDVAVHPAHRRQGIALSLVQQLHTLADDDLLPLRAAVRDDDLPTQLLLKRAGWRAGPLRCPPLSPPILPFFRHLATVLTPPRGT